MHALQGEVTICRLRVNFSGDYPLAPPEIFFEASQQYQPPVHNHIYSNGALQCCVTWQAKCCTSSSSGLTVMNGIHAGHICLDILYQGRNGGWWVLTCLISTWSHPHCSLFMAMRADAVSINVRSPALTISKVVLSLRSMLASCTEKRRPDGDRMCVYKSQCGPRRTVGRMRTVQEERSAAAR